MIRPMSVILFCLWVVIKPVAFAADTDLCNVESDKDRSTQSDRYVEVHSILISGNKVTKARVILNELIVKQGEKVLVNRLGLVIKRSRENLLNTSLFNFVSITYVLQQNETVVFHVKVEERWYWWVFPIFEHADRNFSAFLDNGSWSRVNYGIYIKKDNFRGRNEVLKFRIRNGYSTQFSLYYHSPEYRRKTGLGFAINFNAYNQLPYITASNRPVDLKLLDGVVQYFYKTEVFYSIRSDLFQRHWLTLGYNQYHVQDTVVALNPEYLTPGNDRLRFMELSYQYKYDTRDSKVYPLKGNLFTLKLAKTGFGVWDSDLDDFSVSAQAHKHVKFSSRWNWGTMLKGQISSSKKLPYVIKRGIGYNGFINGYELYVMDGTKSVLYQNKLLFTLIEPRIKRLNFVPLSQFAKLHYAFYLKVFGDLGYVYQNHQVESNNMVNSWQYGYGFGVDLVTFYDKVVSFNYAANKFGQHGFFVHLNLVL